MMRMDGARLRTVSMATSSRVTATSLGPVALSKPRETLGRIWASAARAEPQDDQAAVSARATGGAAVRHAGRSVPGNALKIPEAEPIMSIAPASCPAFIEQVGNLLRFLETVQQLVQVVGEGGGIAFAGRGPGPPQFVHRFLEHGEQGDARAGSPRSRPLRRSCARPPRAGGCPDGTSPALRGCRRPLPGLGKQAPLQALESADGDHGQQQDEGQAEQDLQRPGSPRLMPSGGGVLPGPCSPGRMRLVGARHLLLELAELLLHGREWRAWTATEARAVPPGALRPWFPAAPRPPAGDFAGTARAVDSMRHVSRPGWKSADVLII